MNEDNIIVFSDVHNHYSLKATMLHLNDADMYNLLLSMRRIARYIISNGDFIDGHISNLPTIQSRINSTERTKLKNYKTYGLFEEEDFIYVKGNHDEYYSGKSFSGVYKVNVETIVTHGVEDFFNKNYPKFSAFLTWCLGLLEMLITMKKNGKLYRVGKKFLNLFWFKNSSQLKAFKEMIDVNDKLLAGFFGHTHKQLVIKFNYKDKERLFVNTGRFDGKNRQYVLYNTKTRKVILENKVPVFNYVKLQKDLKFGDNLFSFNEESIVSREIVNDIDFDYSHVMVYIGNGRLIESTKGGVQITLLSKYLNGNYKLLIQRQYDKDKTKSYVNYIKSKLGLNYGYGQLLIDKIVYSTGVWFGHDLRKINIDWSKSEYTCSELIIEATNYVYGLNFPSAIATPKTVYELDEIFYSIKKSKNNYVKEQLVC